MLGVVLLLVSTLSFTRGLQRLVRARLRPADAGHAQHAAGAGVAAFVGASSTLRPIVPSRSAAVARGRLTLATAVALWLVTPYLLLGRRVRWQRLLPSALLTAIGMAGIGIWSVICMPHTFASSAAQFGVIGIGFAMLDLVRRRRLR